MSNGPIQPINDPEVLTGIKRIEAKLREIEDTLRRMKNTLNYISSRQK